jgi:hypothetical protein
MKTMSVVAAALVAAILVLSLMSTQRIAYAQNGLTQTENDEIEEAESEQIEEAESEQIEEAENWPTQTEMEPEDSQITIGLPDFEFP